MSKIQMNSPMGGGIGCGIEFDSPMGGGIGCGR